MVKKVKERKTGRRARAEVDAHSSEVDAKDYIDFPPPTIEDMKHESSSRAKTIKIVAGALAAAAVVYAILTAMEVI